jgi:hypothetical protein
VSEVKIQDGYKHAYINDQCITGGWEGICLDLKHGRIALKVFFAKDGKIAVRMLSGLARPVCTKKPEEVACRANTKDIKPSFHIKYKTLTT